MNTTLYKQHVITRTQTRLAGSTKQLYAIDGPHFKPAALRPFITSAADARRWIVEQIEGDRLCATSS